MYIKGTRIRFNSNLEVALTFRHSESRNYGLFVDKFTLLSCIKNSLTKQTGNRTQPHSSFVSPRSY